jgi:hypothetical protein
MAVLAVLCALATLGGALAPPAPAAGLSPPVADCYANAGQLTHSYSVPALQQALKTMPVEIAEYTTCHDVIQRALLAKLGKVRGGPSGSGGSFLPTWLLVVLILVVVGGVAFGAVAVRNRSRDRGRDRDRDDGRDGEGGS